MREEEESVVWRMGSIGKGHWEEQGMKQAEPERAVREVSRGKAMVGRKPSGFPGQREQQWYVRDGKAKREEDREKRGDYKQIRVGKRKERTLVEAWQRGNAAVC